MNVFVRFASLQEVHAADADRSRGFFSQKRDSEDPFQCGVIVSFRDPILSSLITVNGLATGSRAFLSLHSD